MNITSLEELRRVVAHVDEHDLHWVIVKVNLVRELLEQLPKESQMPDEELPAFRPKPGDIVQLHPEKTRNKGFAGALMVVDEVKSWGVRGYITMLGDRDGMGGGQAYYRAGYDEILPTGGQAPFMVE